MGTIKYKEYEGTAEYDSEREVFRGKILFITDVVTYQAADAKGLKQEFGAAVDDYIQTCKELGRDPQKPFSGVFNVRTSQELHRKAAVRAARENTSLNDIVSKALDSYINGAHDVHNHLHIEVPQEMKTVQAIPGQEQTWIQSPNVQYSH